MDLSEAIEEAAKFEEPGVLLLDAYNLLYRAFTSLPDAIVARDGQPINAVYGMCSAIIRIATDTGATRAVAAFDVPETPTFRHRLFPAYQQQRGPLGGDNAADFSRQVNIALSVFPALGIPALTMPGFEADDVIGTLSVRLASLGQHALIISTDRDLLQLVRPGIAALSPAKDGIHAHDSQAVFARMGVMPEHVTDFKALAGDPSDNIPGVNGIGTKTAAMLVNTYGPLESIFQHVDNLPARIQSALRNGQRDAFLYREVVTVVTDLSLDLDIEQLPQSRLHTGVRARDALESVDYGSSPTKLERDT